MMAATKSPGMFESLRYHSGDDTLGGFWDAIGQIGGATAVWGLNTAFGPPNPNTGCLRTRLSSNSDIQRCVATVMQMFDQVEAMIGLAEPVLIISQAEQIVSHLHNDNFFKQSVSGSAKRTLDAAKQQARQRADAIRARLAPQPAPAAAAVTDPATGQTAAGGLDNSTTKMLLIGGGALALLLLLKG